jgi:hypothetical protein
MKVSKLSITDSITKDFGYVAVQATNLPKAISLLKKTAAANFPDANAIMAVSMQCDGGKIMMDGQAVLFDPSYLDSLQSIGYTPDE